MRQSRRLSLPLPWSLVTHFSLLLPCPEAGYLSEYTHIWVLGSPQRVLVFVPTIGPQCYSRAILPSDGIAVFGVLDKRHVHTHKRGPICRHHLATDERNQARRETYGGGRDTGQAGLLPCPCTYWRHSTTVSNKFWLPQTLSVGNCCCFRAVELVMLRSGLQQLPRALTEPRRPGSHDISCHCLTFARPGPETTFLTHIS